MTPPLFNTPIITALRIHIPITCFRKPHAREYAETFPIAPPATIFGMLLSMIGEENRLQHASARLAIARLVESPKSKVLRTFYRLKNINDLCDGTNRVPDWQELLTDVRMAIWIMDGDSEPAEKSHGTLRQRVQNVLENPASVDRFGALCCGESTHLVDGVWFLAAKPIQIGEQIEHLIPSPMGWLTLPIWPDHIGSKGTRWASFDSDVSDSNWIPSESDWTTICPSK